MGALKTYLFSTVVVTLLSLAHINVVTTEYIDADEHLGRREPEPDMPTNYWTMATVAANTISPLNALSVSSSALNAPPLEAIFNNPDFTPLFQELPKLRNELNQLGKEEQSNTLFLFKVYISLPSTVSPFFHQAVSQMTSVAPALHDLTKFNIAAELSTYVQSIVDPVPNYFTRIATYMQKLQKRAPLPVPSVQTIMGIVGEILLKNIGVPPPLIPFNILQQLLTMLIKAYLEGQLSGLGLPSLPNLPSLSSLTNMVPNALKNPINQLNPLRNLKIPKPKKPRFKRPRF